MTRLPLRISTPRAAGAAVSIAVVMVLLALAPFAAVLEVHHQLAAADQDGHQHSDTDLCQWVQHHAGQSLDIAVPAVERFLDAGLHQFPPPAVLLSVSLIASTPSRAPPFS
jgi:hypothetical protein